MGKREARQDVGGDVLTAIPIEVEARSSRALGIAEEGRAGGDDPGIGEIGGIGEPELESTLFMRGDKSTTVGPIDSRVAPLARALVGWRIEGQLFVLGVGAADGGVVKEQRRSEDGGRWICEIVRHPEIAARSLNAGAKSAFVNVGKHCAAHQLALAVGADAVEESRCAIRRPLFARNKRC